MKAALNGVLHLSILDGWWPEGFNGKNGWAYGEEPEANKDGQDAVAIDAILEQQAVPLYYQVNDEGIPVERVKMMKAAMKSSGPFFSARRMVKEYSRKFYQPALQSTANEHPR